MCDLDLHRRMADSRIGVARPDVREHSPLGAPAEGWEAGMNAEQRNTDKILAFLLWLYLSGCVGVFGVCFCAARAEMKENANIHPEKHPE